MQSRSTHNPSLPFIKERWKGNLLSKESTYINLDGPSERSFSELLKWQTSRNRLRQAKKKKGVGIDVIASPHLISNREEGFTWLGHASYLFTLQGQHFITDPVLYNVGPVKRLTSLPCSAEELQQIDFILLSHNHRDHADQKSMQLLCTLNPNAVILTGLEIGKLLRSWKITNPIIEAGWYQQYQIASDVKITYLPAKHWNRRGLTDMNTMLWGSFMLQTPKHTLYFGADSGLGIHFAEIGQLFPTIDFAFLGIGAYMPEWFMHTSHTSPADVLQAQLHLGAQQVVPMHHGTFDLSDEPVYYPKQELLHLQELHGFDRVLHLSIGQKQQW
jgi:L-ascorbate metabolism protein UlaG (beta-lactamase superfamily)